MAKQYDAPVIAEISPLLRLKTLAGTHDFDLSRLCPLSGLESGTNADTNPQILSTIRLLMFAMDILDETFTEITGFKRHIYILGDGTIFNFLKKKITYGGITNIDKSYCLEIMCTLGLSYRFNVATKFGYIETNVMQLRLNGWGRTFCHDEDNHQDYIVLKRDLCNYWEPILRRYKSDYMELTTRCDSLERPLNVTQIHKINTFVPITIVT